MIFDRTEQQPGARLLFLLACFVVVVWGMKFAAPILLPAALALFLTVLSLPAMLWLRRHHVPGWLAISITILMNLGILGLVVVLAAGSLSQFQEKLPEYVSSLDALQAVVITWLETHTGFAFREHVGATVVNPTAIMNWARVGLGYAAQFVSTTILVFIVMSFMLSEAMVFPEKVRYLRGADVPPDDRLTKVVGEVQSYLGIKFVVSAATGLLLGVWCWYLKLDLPVLLGITAFLLNFIPTVGAIIATAPAILLSLVIHGTLGHVLLVSAGYLAVNMVLGNILEPHLQGRRLGLSTLVIVLSLLFWGWAWGPVGALLSVPLTVVVKIWLENTRDLKWVAVLLDPSAPKLSPSVGAVPSAVPSSSVASSSG